MRVSPTGQSEYHEGNEVGRYGRDIAASEDYFVWYHNGIGDEPIWGMDVPVEAQISVSVDVILVADENNGLYRIPRDSLTAQRRDLGDRDQYVITERHNHVEYLGDPDDYLRGDLWIDSHRKNTHYHQKKNHA